MLFSDDYCYREEGPVWTELSFMKQKAGDFLKAEAKALRVTKGVGFLWLSHMALLVGVYPEETQMAVPS